MPAGNRKSADSHLPRQVNGGRLPCLAVNLRIIASKSTHMLERHYDGGISPSRGGTCSHALVTFRDQAGRRASSHPYRKPVNLASTREASTKTRIFLSHTHAHTHARARAHTHTHTHAQDTPAQCPEDKNVPTRPTLGAEHRNPRKPSTSITGTDLPCTSSRPQPRPRGEGGASGDHPVHFCLSHRVLGGQVGVGVGDEVNVFCGAPVPLPWRRRGRARPC